MRRIVTVVALASSLTACTAVDENREPWCRPTPATSLMARSVPSAASVPCVRELPSGWVFDGFTASDAGSTFALVEAEGSGGRVDVTFSGACPSASGTLATSDERGVELLEEVRREEPFSARWTYRFEGGCTHVDVALGADADVGRARQDLMRALSFVRLG